MSTYAQQAALAQDAGFRGRLRVALTKAAAAILTAPVDNAHPETQQLRDTLATQIMQDAAAFLDMFAWAAVQVSDISNEVATSTVAISQTTAGPPSVITTSTPHGMTSGTNVNIQGTVDPALPGWYAITVTGASTFTIPAVGSMAGGAGGTVVSGPDDNAIGSALSQVFSQLAGVTPDTV